MDRTPRGARRAGGLRHPRRGLGRQHQEGRPGAEELRQGRRRQGRPRHAHRLGPGGPRRPGRAGQAPQRGVPGEVPEREDQPRGEVFTNLKTTLKLAVSSNKAPDVVEANQGRPDMGQMVKGGLLKPLDAYADAYGWKDRWSKTLLDLNRFSADGKAFGAGNLYGV